MKKIILFFTIAILLFGCSDDLLEVTPIDRISETSVWTSENLVQSYVNAQYVVLLSEYSAFGGGVGDGNNMRYYSDEGYSKYNPGSGQSWRTNSLQADNVTGLSAQLDFWEMGYEYLYNINVFFENIDAAAEKNSFDADAVVDMKGEMSLLRAYIYSTLLNSYGGVPIITKVFNLSEDLTGITRNSYQEVFDYIMIDLNYVIDNMDDQSAQKGRACGDVAQAMKARLLLYDASPLNNPSNNLDKWQDASDAAWELISSNHYSLYGDYTSLFYTSENSEIIWQKSFSTDSPHKQAQFQAPPMAGGWGNGQPTQNLADMFEMQATGEVPYLKYDANTILTPTVNPTSGFDPVNPYTGRDPRFYTLVAHNESVWKGATIYTYTGAVSQDEAVTGYYSYKFLNPNEPVSFGFDYTTPWILYRLAEVYLNYAEAEYNLGHEDVAREYLNKVRERVNMPEVTESGDELWERIVRERQVELCFEGHRYYDIRRWEIAEETQTLPVIGQTVTKNTDGSYSYSRKQILPGFWDNKQFYVPIPYEEIQKSNLSLVQNPGWE